MMVKGSIKIILTTISLSVVASAAADDSTYCQPTGERPDAETVRKQMNEMLEATLIGETPLSDFYRKPPPLIIRTYGDQTYYYQTPERKDFVERGPMDIHDGLTKPWDTRHISQKAADEQTTVLHADRSCTDLAYRWRGPEAERTENSPVGWYFRKIRISGREQWSNIRRSSVIGAYNRCFYITYPSDDHIKLYGVRHIDNAKMIYPWADLIRFPRELPAPRFSELMYDWAKKTGMDDLTSLLLLDEYGPPTDIIVLPPYGYAAAAAERAKQGYTGKIAYLFLSVIDNINNCDTGLIPHNLKLIDQQLDGIEFSTNKNYHMLLTMIKKHNISYQVALDNLRADYMKTWLDSGYDPLH